MKTVAVLGVVASLNSLASAQTYSIQVFNPGIPGISAVPTGLSQNGKVTGYSVDENSILRAFIWQNGIYQDVGTLGYESAVGQAINNSGQMAVIRYTPGWHAARWTNGQVKSLGSIDGGNSCPLAINSRGDIVGYAINGDGGRQGFTYINGKFTGLPVDRCSDINDTQVFVGGVGFFWTVGHYMYAVDHPFISNGASLVDLGDLGGGTHTEGQAFGINNAGEVTGYSTTAFYAQHAFLWSGGVMQDLGTIGNFISVGLCVNTHSTVMGALCLGNIYNQVGTFVYKNGQMRNLAEFLGPAASGWSNLVGAKMNDAGWIVGYGTFNGTQQGFIAKPGLPKAIPTPD